MRLHEFLESPIERNRFSTISVRLSKSHAESCAAAVTFANALFLWGCLAILCVDGPISSDYNRTESLNEA